MNEGAHTTLVMHETQRLMDYELTAIWQRLEDGLGSGKTAEASEYRDVDYGLWGSVIDTLRRDYNLSSRLALMRLLSARVQNGELHRPVPPEALANMGSFSRCPAAAQGQPDFSNVSAEKAEALTEEESEAWLRCLESLAACREDFDEGLCRFLLRLAWDIREYTKQKDTLPEAAAGANEKQRQRQNKGSRTRLTRQQALELGHMLGLSLAEMEWVLLRVFDSEEFCPNRSDDLLECYGFLTGCSAAHLARLKEEYRRMYKAAKIIKQPRDTLPMSTQAVKDDLQALVPQWREGADTDGAFLVWIMRQAPWLDSPSRTALRLYRELAVYAGMLVTGQMALPDAGTLHDDILDMEDGTLSLPVEEWLFTDGKIDEKKCIRLETALLLENKRDQDGGFSDRSASWRVLGSNSLGGLNSAAGRVNRRDRLQRLLMGKEEAEKGDILILLWFLCNRCWREEETDGATKLADFEEFCERLLPAAGLPRFYPPHPMERSMLLSLILAEKDEENSAAVIYAYLLNWQRIQNHRKRGKKNSPSYSGAEMLEILHNYRSPARKQNLIDFSKSYHISDKTLSAWQQSYSRLQDHREEILAAYTENNLKDLIAAYKVPKKLVAAWLNEERDQKPRPIKK